MLNREIVDLPDAQGVRCSATPAPPGMIFQYLRHSDGRHCFPYASEAVAGLLGTPPHQAAADGAGAFAIIHPDDHDGVLQTIEDSARALQLCETEFRVNHPSRGALRLSWNARPERMADGGTLWYGLLRDVTGKEVLRRKLPERELFSSTLDGLSAQICVIDDRGTVILTNRAWDEFAAVNGADPGSCGPGTNYLDACAAPNVDHEPDSAQFSEAVRGVVTGKLPVFRMEYTCHSPAEQRWFNCTITPVTVAGVRHAVLAHENITGRKLAEMELRAAKEHFQAMVDSSPNGILVFRADRVIACNPAGARMFGAPSRRDLLGKHPAELSPPCQPDGSPSRPSAERLLAAAAGGGGTDTDFEWTHQRLDTGATFITETRLVPVAIYGTSAVVAFLRDISERKRMEAELRQAAAELETAHDVLVAIVDSMPDWLWEVDSQWRYTYCSPRVESHLGYTPAEMLGKTPFDFMPLEETGRVSAQLIEIIQENGRILNLENWNLHKDGSLVLHSTNGAPILDAGGNLAGYRGVDTDITEVRRNQAQLAKLSRAVEQSPVATVMTDLRGVIEFVNPSFTELNGYSAAESIGRNPRLLKSGATPPGTIERLWSKLLAGDVWQGEMVNRRKDGTLYHGFSSISPLRDAAGTVTHYVAVTEDISEKKRLSEELRLAKEVAEQATRAKSAFLATMSHELRTPLNGVIGMTDLLAETKLNAEQGEYLAVMQSSGDMLQRLVGDILDLAKIEAGTLTLVAAPFKLRDGIGRILGVLSEPARRKGLSPTSRLAEGIPDWLVGDSDRLMQVLLNLLGNAVKFTERGSVTLEVEPVTVADAEILLKFSVADTGIGIAPEKLQEIFSPFSQGGYSTTGVYGGTGLGLAISRQLVHLMGGEVELQSTLGVGSRISFTCRFAAQVEPPRATAPTAAPSLVRPLSILLVDDSHANRTVLRAYFLSTAHHVETAENGAQALERIKRGGIDLVFMDLEMPVMDGYLAVRLVRLWEAGTGRAPLPVIALTAHALDEFRKRSLTAGCNEYLTKPIRKARLLEVVDGYAALPQPRGGTLAP